MVVDFGSYVGIPFVARGRDRAGVDCWGLLCLVYAEQLGIDLPAYDHVSPRDSTETVALAAAGVIAETWNVVPAGAEMQADAILLRLVGAGLHCGLVTSRRCMLHALEGVGVCHERYDGTLWRERVHGFYRHRELAGA